MRVGIVGAGWSGLALATFLQERGVDATLFEAAPEVGGRAATTREDGWLVEHGPHAIQRGGAAVERLAQAADVAFDDAPRGAPRFVVHDRRPVPLPMTPPALMRTPLLTPAAKARLLAEPFQPAGPDDETVAAFFTRRLGRGAAHIVDAFQTGVYGGDPERLVARRAFPRLARMEREGGLLRSAFGKPAAPRGPLTAPREGTGAWMKALAARLDVRTKTPVAAVDDEAHVLLASGEREAFDRVVLAVDPPAAQRLLGLAAVAPPPVAPVTVVAFGTRADDAPAEGYGVLAPEQEQRFVLGALYESALFPERAPQGHALVRCMVGGRRHPERARLPPDELTERAWADLVDLGVVRGEPVRTWVRPTAGIPQPEAGHAAWCASLPQEGRVRVVGVGQPHVGLVGLAEEASALADALAADNDVSRAA